MSMKKLNQYVVLSLMVALLITLFFPVMNVSALDIGDFQTEDENTGLEILPEEAENLSSDINDAPGASIDSENDPPLPGVVDNIMENIDEDSGNSFDAEFEDSSYSDDQNDLTESKNQTIDSIENQSEEDTQLANSTDEEFSLTKSEDPEIEEMLSSNDGAITLIKGSGLSLYNIDV